ncbi:MAG: hypothetical protein FJX76_01890 [Armatimonadetes bacterium]|nr:hypothetical protein [Armatimonadota bacterium]
MFQFWTDFISSLLKKDDSSQMAAARLKGSVFLDRLSLSPATLDLIRTDVVRSISRYLVIDENQMTLAVQAEGRSLALAASIPVLRPRMEPIAEPQAVARAATQTVEIDARTDPARAGITVYERARARAMRRKRQVKR